MFQEADFGFRQELNQQVDIAILPHLSPSGGAKYSQLPHEVSPAKLGEPIFFDIDNSKMDHGLHPLCRRALLDQHKARWQFFPEDPL
jgi:hypothetical protein